MAKIILRQEAIDDLKNIWEYTFEKWSESQADKYYSMLKLSCKEIGKNPEIGKEYDEINKNLFGLSCFFLASPIMMGPVGVESGIILLRKGLQVFLKIS